MAPYIPLAIVLVGVLSYLNTFANPFLFDDVRVIAANPTIDRLLPIVFRTRWIVDLSFRLNYAIGQFTVADYHAVNLAIHLAAALFLFGIVRRTLRLPRLRERWGEAAAWLAGAGALLFVAHPLQTAAVTYVCQRYEAMMAMFFLATLYGFIRAVSARGARARGAWSLASVSACLLGMGAKEVMLTAPLVVLLYDWIFLRESMPVPRRWRAGVHIGLWLTLVAFAAMEMRLLAGLSETGRRLTSPVSPWLYLATQTEVILHYARLGVWPAGQCLDYAWPPAEGWAAVWPSAWLLGTAGCVTLWGIVKRAPWAFPGGFFFLVLGPSSSLLPAPDVAFEHRMYLPLAALLVAIVLGVYALSRRRLAGYRRSPLMGLAAVLAVTLALAVTTHRRNRVYASREAMWSDVAVKQPGNYRQRLALFNALVEQGEARAAERVIRELMDDTKPGFDRKESSPAPGRDPFLHHALARGQLGRLLLLRGEWTGAVEHLALAILALPENAVAHHNMALALGALNRHEEAIRAARESVRLDPDNAKGCATLAFLLARGGAYAEAAEQYRHAIALSPPLHHALNLERAWLLATAPDAAVRDGAEAERLATEAYRATGERSIRALDAMAAALAEQGRFGDAQIRVGQALALASDPDAEGAAATPADACGLGGWGPATDRATLLNRQARYAARMPYRSTPGGGRP
jgi:tetratricopeptide (TPR) repeat protein